VSRPTLEVADILREHGTGFIEHNRSWLSWLHIKVLLAIQRCRTAALGGHVDECVDCEDRVTSYNSCLMGSISLWGVGRLKPPCLLIESAF
jgi:hypothetical protein